MSSGAIRVVTPIDRPPGKSRLRRVLYAIGLDPTRKFGSLEEQILTLALAARREGGAFVPLFVTAAKAAEAKGFPEAGIEVACLDLERWRWDTLWQLWRLIRRHRIEVIHWNMMPPLRNAYIWALTVLTPGVRHFFTDHSSRDVPLPEPPRGLARFVKRLLLARYSRVIGVSGYVRQSLKEQNVWRQPCCQMHFINTERFKPNPEMRADMRRRMGVEDRFVILLVANLIRDKGVAVALRALAELPPSVVLWIAGEGVEAANLKALAQDLKVAERANFLGNQVHVQPFMQAADCAACPSLWAEAAGLVNLEAQACGLPVIASHIGGIPEYVHHGRTGLLFPPGDHGAMAACVRRLLEEPDLCRQLGDAALQLAKEQFSIEARLGEYLDHYRV